MYTSVDIPILIVGCLTIVAGLLTLLLPETLHAALPDTIEDVEEFGLVRKQKKKEKKKSVEASESQPSDVLVCDANGSLLDETNL